jgi:hypothetical protein
MRAVSRGVLGVLLAATALSLPVGLQAQTERKLDISFANGRVTLVAANVTVSDILAEWARRGGTVIVNGERLGGGPLPVPVQYVNQPEEQVMISLLRKAAGYAFVPCVPSDKPCVSTLARVQILATSTPTSGVPFVSTPAVSVQSPPPGFGSPEDEIPPVTPVQNPGQQTPRPGTAPGTSPVPGQVVPVQGVPPGTVTPPAGPGRVGRGGGR